MASPLEFVCAAVALLLVAAGWAGLAIICEVWRLERGSARRENEELDW